MKIVNLLFIIFLAIVIGACGAATEQKNVDPKPDTTTAEKKDETKPETKPETSDAATKSPTEVVKAFIQAYKDKDVEGMKKIVSKKSLDEMEKSAKEGKMTLDEALKKFMEIDLPFKGDPEFRNEKIDGDKATVEIKVEDKWEPTPLVKEDGQWKFDFEEQK